jgi:hypothetical protein
MLVREEEFKKYHPKSFNELIKVFEQSGKSV